MTTTTEALDRIREALGAAYERDDLAALYAAASVLMLAMEHGGDLAVPDLAALAARAITDDDIPDPAARVGTFADQLLDLLHGPRL